MSALPEVLERWKQEHPRDAVRVVARSDPETFLNHFCWIRDFQTGVEQRYRERPAQAALRELIGGERLVVGLKAREVGWTWALALFVLWEAWRYSPYQCIYLSQREDNAHDFIRRIRWAHSKLPEWLGYPPEDKPIAKQRFAISEGYESEVLAFPSVPTAIQTWHPRRVIADEWGLIQERVLPSALGAVGLRGYFLGLGTAEGLANEHAQVYTSCRDGEPELFAPEGRRFHHIFASWRDNPTNCLVECRCGWKGTREDITDEQAGKRQCPRCAGTPGRGGHADAGLRFQWVRPSAGERRETERMYPENDQEAFLLTAPGEAVYPEFSAEFHVAKGPLKADPTLPLIRGWDFGYNRPACVVFQLNRLGQCVILREHMGREVGIREFARGVLEQCNVEFPNARWSDWGDPSGRAHRETDAKSCFKILRDDFGLVLRAGKSQWNLRREAVAKRLTRIVNGVPALVVDPSCRLLIQGFAGMYHYPKARRREEQQDAFERMRHEMRRAAAIHA